MPDLIQSLQGRDLGHLRIVASLWGVELKSVEIEPAFQELAADLLVPELAGEVVSTLPAEAQEALAALAAEGGRMPWATFIRHYGEIREVGPGRRDRDQIHLNPISAAETLYYRALLARAFFDTPSGAQEFAYLPNDLMPLIHPLVRPGGAKGKKPTASKTPPAPEPPEEPLGRPATPIERTEIILASDRILDDACTLLAALRLGWEGVPRPENLSVPEKVLREILVADGLIADQGPQLEAIKNFLAASRGEALAWLVKSWLNSETFNELHQLPGLVCEGEWSNQPLVTRRFLLGLLGPIPTGTWWSLNAFVRLIKEKYSDFQRPAGDYDSWFIKRVSDGVYLRGFVAWDEVDGALIRYLLTGPLHWLGVVDLALPDPEKAPSAFRMTPSASRLLGGTGSERASQETARLHVSSQGRISVPRLAPRALRYQIARFCDWEDEKVEEYRYRVTPSALQRAKEQGLKIEQLLTLLRKFTAAPVPPVFLRALQRWERKGTEARLESQVILRLASPEVLEELRASKMARFLGDVLGPAAVVVKPGAQSKVLAGLAEMGLLAEEAAKDGQVEGRSGGP